MHIQRIETWEKHWFNTKESTRIRILGRWMRVPRYLKNWKLQTNSFLIKSLLTLESSTRLLPMIFIILEPHPLTLGFLICKTQINGSQLVPMVSCLPPTKLLNEVGYLSQAASTTLANLSSQHTRFISYVLWTIINCTSWLRLDQEWQENKIRFLCKILI